MINAPYLIDEWEQVHNLLAPSFAQFRGPETSVGSTAAGVFTDRVIGELALLSGRRSVWEASVCLVDYAEQWAPPGPVEPPSFVLRNIDFHAHFDDTNSWSSEPYFAHCQRLATLSLEELIPAAYVLKLSFRDGVVFNQLGTLETFQECYRLHRPDWQKIRECMRNK